MDKFDWQVTASFVHYRSLLITEQGAGWKSLCTWWHHSRIPPLPLQSPRMDPDFVLACSVIWGKYHWCCFLPCPMKCKKILIHDALVWTVFVNNRSSEQALVPSGFLWEKFTRTFCPFFPTEPIDPFFFILMHWNTSMPCEILIACCEDLCSLEGDLLSWGN